MNPLLNHTPVQFCLGYMVLHQLFYLKNQKALCTKNPKGVKLHISHQNQNLHVLQSSSLYLRILLSIQQPIYYQRDFLNQVYSLIGDEEKILNPQYSYYLECILKYHYFLSLLEHSNVLYFSDSFLINLSIKSQSKPFLSKKSIFFLSSFKSLLSPYFF